jgi:hypothetical protein
MRAAQCLDRGIERVEQLTAKIAAWHRECDAVGARFKWMFTTEKACAKIGRAYPKLHTSSGQAKRVKDHCVVVLVGKTDHGDERRLRAAAWPAHASG